MISKKNILKLIIVLSFTMLQSACSQSTHNEKSGVKWLDFEDAVSKSDVSPKKMLIDVYTDWCGWCKRMDQSTYKDTALINFINKNYYPVKLNAETKDTIQFRGKSFAFRPEYKANEIALSLLSGKMGYPTTVLLDEKMNIISVNPGYLDAEGMFDLLKSKEKGK